MDNLTHSLVGLAAARAGLEKLSPGATTLCILAANAPDSDIVVLLFRDRWSFLEHHRGITHSILGTICLAFLIPLLFFLVDLLISALKKRPRQVRFSGLLLASIVVAFTHPLLDWTNSYGIRPLLPWNSTWIYGDLVFIVDPLMWLVLGSACFLLSSRTRSANAVWLCVGLVVTLLIMLAPRAGNLPEPWLIRGLWLACMATLIVLFVRNTGERWGRKLALGSLVLVVLYWGGLWFIHREALLRAGAEALRIAGSDESVSRLAAMPTLANPVKWECVFVTDKATYRFNLNLVGNTPVSRIIRYEKPAGLLDTALREIGDDRRTQIFLGFARFPVARLAEQDCTTQTLVQLADLRYTEPGASRGVFSLELPIDCLHPLTVNR